MRDIVSKRLLIFLLFAACKSDYPLPDIDIKLNVPFFLRNTASVHTPDNNVDRAVYGSDTLNVVIKLDTIRNLKCGGCLTKQVVSQVQLSINDKSVILVDDYLPSEPKLSNVYMSSNFRITLMAVQGYSEKNDPSLQGSYRIVKLLLSER